MVDADNSVSLLFVSTTTLPSHVQHLLPPISPLSSTMLSLYPIWINSDNVATFTLPHHSLHPLYRRYYNPVPPFFFLSSGIFDERNVLVRLGLGAYYDGDDSLPCIRVN